MTDRIYPKVRQAARQKELDRNTWADNTLLIISYDTEGVGAIQSGLIDFGVVYEGVPFFAYGVELHPEQSLVAGDFPEVSAGVESWETTVPRDDQAEPFYLGAYLWFSVRANTPYKLRFRLSFEGIAMKNVEYFRG